MPRAPVVIATTILLAACASGGGSRTDGSSSVISRAQVQATPADNAYQIVQRLHPDWLIKRGRATIEGDEDIIVYYNNARMGGPDALRQIQPGPIQEIRFYSAREAQFKWGTGHLNGAIQVVTGTGTDET